MHAVRGAGPVTFFPSKGAPVTLSFGESVERPILSGLFQARIAWLPDGSGGDRTDYEGSPVIIRGGDRLELYAVKNPGLSREGAMIFIWGWARAASVPPDSALVRFIQSSPFIAFDVRPPDATYTFTLASGTPRHCYFDPGDLTEYAPLAAGDFDLILKDKLESPVQARIRATAPGGRAIAYVIIGETAETARLLAFPDP